MREQLVGSFLVMKSALYKGADGQGQNMPLFFVHGIEQIVHVSQHLVDGPGVFRVAEQPVDAQVVKEAKPVAIVQERSDLRRMASLGKGGNSLGNRVAAADAGGIMLAISA